MDDTARLGWERQAQLMDYLLNHSPDAIIGVDEENRVRVFNQRAEETFGYSFRDLEGQPLSRILPNFPLTAGRTLPTEDAWHNGGENSGAQGMWAFGQRKDGTRVTVEVCPSCLQAENDSLLVLQTRATTDSQKAWRRLERIVDGLRNIPEIVWIADSKGMDHFRETEIPGTGETPLPLDDPNQPQWALRKVRKEGLPSAKRRGVWIGSTAFLDEQGQEVPVDQIIMIHYDPEDRQNHFSSIIRDLSGSSARDTEVRLLAEVFQIGIATLIANLDGALLRVNPAFCDDSGYEAVELVGSHLTTLVSCIHGPDFLGAVLEEIQETGHWQGELWLQHPSGRNVPKWAVFTLVEWGSHSGDENYLVGVFSDLEEEKREEYERGHRMDASAQLGNVLAHQLNQPLAGIQNYMQGALHRLRHRPPTSEELCGVMETVLSQADRARALVQDLRGYLRGDEAQLRSLEISQLFTPLRSALSPTLTEHGVDLVMDIPEDLPPVRGNWVQLEECLLNLLVNAVESMAETGDGDRRVDVRVRERLGQVEIQVQDRGHGMPDGLEEEVFQTGFTSKSEGTGLGLPICRSFIEGLGGQVWAEARDTGPGTIFTVRLPATDPSAEQPPG